MIEQDVKKLINKDFQIKKFCFYGFLKNLKFYEPYLIIFLLASNISLFEIGLLIAIRELVINIFEIPSGIIADHFGRKKELYICFGFYIISFIVFFFTVNFYIAIFAMILFGLGEAFRSGTHKAMIYSYLDSKNLEDYKVYVYGKTRAYSLIGSTLNSIVAIVLILAVPNNHYIFLCSILPYILNVILISTYPKFLDTCDKVHDRSLKEFLRTTILQLKENKSLSKILLEDGIVEGSFSYGKDLIQPIIEVLVAGGGLILISSLSADDNLKIILGITYGILNLAGALFSRKAYLFKRNRTSLQCLFIIHILMFVSFGLLAYFTKQYIIVCIVYLLLFIIHSMRKPIFIDEIDSNIEKSSRATYISVAAQLKSLFLIILAPLFGFIADSYGINYVMLSLCIIFFLTIPIILVKRNNDVK